jgi:hypothetical protein
VKQKENIFEELDRMRNLIHTRPGVVISEQANAGADVGAIMRELDKTNSDESAIVNIVKKYKDKASFKNFTDQYKTISGKDFGTDVYRAIQPYNDKTEWADLSNHLKSMGITLGNATTNGGRGGTATLTGLDTPVTPAAAGAAAGDRQKNINAIFCSVKNGTITNPSSQFKNTPWESWKNTYKPTDAEIEVAKKSCSSGQRSGQRSGQNSSSVNTRFVDSAKSLGIQNAKMDMATLQTMLKSLQGETSTDTPTQETPDIATLTAALNQLKQ